MLTTLTLPYKILIISGFLIASHTFVAFKVWDYMQDMYDLKEAEIRIEQIEVEKEVKVLDEKALVKALKNQSKILNENFESERNAYEWLLKNKDDECLTRPILDDDGLRLWNRENTGPVN